MTPPRPRSRSIVTFLAVVLGALTACWLMVGTLFAPVVPGGAGAVVGAALLGTWVPFAAFVLHRIRQDYPGALFRLLVYRPFWYLQLFLLLATPVAFIAIMVGWPLGAAAAAGRVAFAAVAMVFVTLAVAGYVGSRRLRFRRLIVSHPALPLAFEGLRVAQISDLHVGPHTPREFLARVARAVAEAKPDVVAVTGDLVDDHAGDVAHYAAAFGDLAAPLGVFVIPGNHDVYAGWGGVRERLAGLPVRVLVNRTAALQRNGQRMLVAGTGDPAGRWRGEGAPDSAAPDLAAALQDVGPGDFVLALAHNPALWPGLAERGVPLTLSGHTHWGQLAIPALGWSLAGVFLDLAMGVYQRDGSLLYVHPGTNYWGIPFRLGAPPEVTVFELRRGPAPRITIG